MCIFLLIIYDRFKVYLLEYSYKLYLGEVL